MWQVETVLDGHRNTVTSLAWAPDGTMLVSSSFDKTVRLWGQVKDQGKSKFQSYGIWSAYSNATMAVAWALRPMEEPYGASVICVATMNSPTFLMDAGEAGQSYMTCSRAEHTLVQGIAVLIRPVLPAIC